MLIPSFNPGGALAETVRGAVAAWPDVWVVSDGSTDGSDVGIEKLGARVVRLGRNGGKGAAVRAGLTAAAAAGFTHALVMDADGQHPAERIGAFMAASAARPGALVLGVPVFGSDAPAERVWGRQVANLCTRALAPGVGDALFGFRVYPVGPLLEAFGQTRWMRGFDFDPEAVIRLVRAGLPVVNMPAAVRYPRPEQGGVSHFRYLRDNLVLGWMFARLAAGR